MGLKTLLITAFTGGLGAGASAGGAAAGGGGGLASILSGALAQKEQQAIEQSSPLGKLFDSLFGGDKGSDTFDFSSFPEIDTQPDLASLFERQDDESGLGATLGRLGGGLR